MVEITVELVAILAYTAFALFLSLYFVPFKIVPKAWAKAVRTEGHPAKLALTAVLQEAAPLVAASVKVPTLDEIKAAMPKVDLGALTIELDPIRTIIREEIAAFEKRRGAAHARGETPEVSEAEAERVKKAAENPEGAELLGRALKALDRMVDLGVIKSPTAKRYAKELREEFAQSGDITNLIKSFGIDPAILGAPSVALKGGSSGVPEFAR